jgi:ABC-type microcin C transport system permease subunit YejB
MAQLAMAGLLLFGFLAVASLITAVNKFFPVRKWIVHWVNTHRQKTAVRNYIPHMTDEERAIIAYLLAKNQKTFIAEVNGGYAMTLISRGIVVRAVVQDQVFDFRNTPMAIPDHIWDVLVQHKDQFPYTPPEDGTEVLPWRVHWMAR